MHHLRDLNNIHKIGLSWTWLPATCLRLCKLLARLSASENGCRSSAENEKLRQRITSSDSSSVRPGYNVLAAAEPPRAGMAPIIIRNKNQMQKNNLLQSRGFRMIMIETWVVQFVALCCWNAETRGRRGTGIENTCHLERTSGYRSNRVALRLLLHSHSADGPCAHVRIPVATNRLKIGTLRPRMNINARNFEPASAIHLSSFY